MRIAGWSLFAACLLLSASAVAEVPGTLLGRWQLIEQYYGEGGHNFHGPEDELLVEFRLEAGDLAGTVGWSGTRAPWPAFPMPNGAADVRAVRVEVNAELNGAVATYRVPSAGGEETTLAVTERWHLDDDTLRCEVEIRFERGGEARGGFVWRRVFERVGP